jgi:hypothetical protein
MGASGTQAGAILRHNNSGRYSMVMLRDSSRKKTIQVHLLVAKTFLGSCSPGIEVNHKDGDKHNPALNNLEYQTKQGNVDHAVDTGLVMHGERHYAAKVTEDQVKTIFLLAAAQVSRKEIALQFSLSKSGLGHILRGKNWKRLRCSI